MSLKTTLLTTLVVSVISFGFVAQAMAQESGEWVPTCYKCDTRDGFTSEWLDLGADFRARQVHRNNRNALDKSNANHENHYTRLRGRFLARLKPTNWMDINARLAWEWFYFDLPHAADNSPDEDIIFDTLNVHMSHKIDYLTLDVVAGRQDILLGSRWLVCDGTPLDGSRSLYFDAARLNIGIEHAPGNNTSLDLIAIGNKGEADGNLKPFNYDNVKANVCEYDETGAIAYLSNTGAVDATTIDAYFIYLHRDAIANNPGKNIADIYTAGSRVAGKVGSAVSYNLEGAVQFGRRQGRIRGRDESMDGEFGINSSVVYDLGCPMQGKVKLGYVYRSGDNENDRGFDILWGRYPQFSEIYAGGPDALENARPAMYNNMHRFSLGFDFKPLDPIKVQTEYNLLVADNVNVNSTAIRGSSPIRGHHFKSHVTWVHNKHLKSRVTGEMLVPGGYYSDNNNDIATFARYELTVTW